MHTCMGIEPTVSVRKYLEIYKYVYLVIIVSLYCDQSQIYGYLLTEVLNYFQCLGGVAVAYLIAVLSVSGSIPRSD